MLLEGIEVSVIVQQVIPALDTAGSDNATDCLTNCDAQAAQRPEVPRRLNSEFAPAEFHMCQSSEQDLRLPERRFVGETLQNLGQDQVPNGQRLAAKQEGCPVYPSRRC